MASPPGRYSAALLLDHFWWGSVFLINVPVTVAGIIAVAILVPESRSREAGGIDYVGVLLSVVGLVLLVYGIVQGGDTSSWLQLSVLGPILGGLAVLAAFAWYETRIEHPSLDVRLFRDRRLSASVGAIALVFFGMGGVFFFTSFYLQNVRGYTPLAAGLLTVPFAAGQLLASPRSAGLVRRYGAKAPSAVGMLVMAAAIACYATLGTATPIWLLGPIFAIQGAAIGVVMPAATAAVMDVLPRERAGAGSALTNVSRQVAVALSVAVLGSILAVFYRTSLSPSLAGLPGRGPGRGVLLDYRHPGCRAAARLGRTAAARARQHRLRKLHAHHHAGRGGARAGRRAGGAALDAGRPGLLPSPASDWSSSRPPSGSRRRPPTTRWPARILPTQPSLPYWKRTCSNAQSERCDPLCSP